MKTPVPGSLSLGNSFPASPPTEGEVSVAYRTRLGRLIQGKAETALQDRLLARYRGQVQLIFTSPPFPLNRKKKYGNATGEAFKEWLAAFAPLFREFLAPTGSIVIEMGNAWVPGEPVMSTLALESLLAFQKRGRLNLCQQFVCHNPARLPSPAEWVTVQRIRVKDAFTNVWWLAPTSRPYADNRRVLQPYSKSMLRLLKRQSYNGGRRPSEHHINPTSFLTDNQGAIPSNVLTISNTRSHESYQSYCRAQGLQMHPARMPEELARFFIDFLTEPGHLVLDPFGGSNTTGAAAESLGRKWLAIEPNSEYIAGSKGRFDSFLG